MGRAAPLGFGASLALHALALLTLTALLKEAPGYQRPSMPIIARLVELQPTPREAPKPAPKKRVTMPVPPAPPPDSATVAQFRQAFISHAGRYLDYPMEAIGAGAEGEVVVSLSFAAGRAAADIRVARSSGHEVLDAQALDMFRRAAAAMALPLALRAHDFDFEVPVVYALKR